jgi:hypothetical protein
MLWTFTAFFLCFDLITIASAQQQHFAATLSGVHEGRSAITPELRQFIQDLQLNGTIPGISIAVVHSGGKIELEGFGESSEDGDKVSTEVRSLVLSSEQLDRSSLPDPLWSRVMLQGFLDRLSWHSNGGFCAWPECDASP